MEHCGVKVSRIGFYFNGAVAVYDAMKSGLKKRIRYVVQIDVE